MTVLTPSRETRLIVAVVVLATIFLAVLLFVAPARFMTEDDAKYLEIGTNVFAGNGPTTVFGVFFPFHSPLWPIVLVGPRILFGLDAVWWGHVLAIASGCGIVALTAYFGSRIWALVGIAAAATLVAFPYFLSLGRGLGLDLPAAFLSLAYLAIGLTAVRRHSLRWAVAAGAVFAVAFLIKEIALPFAPAPFLAGLVRGMPIRSVARLAAATMLVAAVGTSWWFVVYAQQTDTVYRLGTPGWTLAPIGLILAIVGVIGLAFDRPDGPTTAADPPRRSPLRPIPLGWIGTVMWAAVLTLFFARTRSETSAGFLNPSEIRNYVATWLPSLGPILAIGLVGLVLATVERVRAAHVGDGVRATPPTAGAGPGEARVDWASVDDLIVASVCGLPLVLLVVSVGEIPRHYIAQLSILAAIGCAGWLLLARRLTRDPDAATLTITGLACLAAAALVVPPLLDDGAVRRALAFVGLLLTIIAGLIVVPRVLARRPGSARIDSYLPVGLMAGLVVVALALAGLGVLRPRSQADLTKAEAVRVASDWVRANVPRGSTVGFGQILGYEVAITLQGDYRAVMIGETQGLGIDAAAPLGVREIGKPAADDWIALSAAPRLVSTIYGYRSGPLQALIRDHEVRVWVLNALSGSDNPTTIEEALRGASGVGATAWWSGPFGSGDLNTTIFTIDPDRLGFGRPVVVGVDALERIVQALEKEPSRSSITATSLLERVVIRPDGASARDLLERLRKVAATQPTGVVGKDAPPIR